MKHRLFISIHVPKTAGTSFQHFLASIFGDHLLLDYRSKPLDIGYEQRAINNLAEDTATYQDIARLLESADVCVHGHFLPAKYLAIFPSASVLSWVREPAQRLMSHYAFWQQNPQPNHIIAKRVVNDGLSFDAFCELDLMRNINSRFFGGLATSRFDFIGVTEHYEESVQRLCELYAWSHTHQTAPTAIKDRQNPLKSQAEYSLSSRELSRIQTLNPLDYKLYRSVLEEQCFSA